MANKTEELTPMMRQYQEIKREHQDKVLFFRLGDFYEMFNEDAIEVSKLLNLTLTHRGATPMCGIPYHAAKNYIGRLLEEGKKVAICEQINLNENSRQIAERKVIQVYTPATVVEDEYLENDETSFILSLSLKAKEIYLSYADITSGAFYVQKVKLSQDYSNLSDALCTIMAKEILVSDDLYFTNKGLKSVLDSSGAIITKLPSYYFSVKSGKKEIERQFGKIDLSDFKIGEKDPILEPISALLLYLNEMVKSSLPQLRVIEWKREEEYLYMNAATIRSLELVESMRDKKGNYTLYKAINRCVTASGARRLKSEILTPKANIDVINKRLDWVEHFYSNPEELKEVRSSLKEVADLERLSSRMSLLKALPKDFTALTFSLDIMFSLFVKYQQYLELIDNNEDIDFSALIEFSEKIKSAINPECTNINNEGTIILDGFDDKLDHYRKIIAESSEILSSYIEKEKEKSGLTILKAGENKIIGHYLEVPKGQVSKVPDYFIRKQTLVTGERYTTEELIKIEEEISGASTEAAIREKEIYRQFLKDASAMAEKIEKVGRLLSLLDFYSSAAQLAKEMNYTRPHLNAENKLVIKDGRHPVVEAYMGRNEFISNDFSSEKGCFALVTGPNMAGKSTYLRQIALIAILSHMGFFVPAREAEIPLLDKLFCRVGAQDNLAKGESTFLVEMSEASQILRSASINSLIIMDEIGRGTSTEDGMSIAYAIIEYLKNLGSITLFSTHYHELTHFDTYKMQLITLKVEENKDGIVFLRKATEGVATSSYGIHVARLAGLPKEVIKSAITFQKKHFADYDMKNRDADLFIANDIEFSLDNDLLDEIRSFDINTSSPLDAFNLILDLKKRLDS